MTEGKNKKLVIKTTRTRLFFHVFLILLPVLFLAIFFSMKIREQVKTRASENFQSLLQLLSAQHEQYLHDGQQLLYVLAHDNDIIQQNVDECKRLLSDIKKDYAFYANIFLLDTNGQSLCSTGASPEHVVNVGLFRQYFTEVMRSKDFTISDYSIGITSRKPVIILALPVFDKEKNITGVIAASMDLEWINKSIATFNLPTNRSLLIVDGAGNILGGFWSEEKLIGRSIANTDIFKKIKARQGEGGFVSKDIDGVEKIFTFTQLSGLPSNHPIYIVLGLPKKEVDSVTTAFNHGQLSTWTLTLIAFFSIMYFVMSHYSQTSRELESNIGNKKSRSKNCK